jgi:DNA-binding transcriptional regulator YiaG
MVHHFHIFNDFNCFRTYSYEAFILGRLKYLYYQPYEDVMTGNEFKNLRLSLAMTQTELGKLIKKHYVTIGEWERRGAEELPLRGRQTYMKLMKIIEGAK